jgi:hypothetical protein
MSPLVHHELANILRRSESPDVEKHQQLAAAGRELRTRVLQLPSAVDLNEALLREIQQYASDCGDTLVTNALTRRLRPVSNRRLPFSGGLKQ